MLRFGRCGLGVHMEQRASPGTVQVIAGTDGSMRDDVWVRLGSWGSLFARWRRKLWNMENGAAGKRRCSSERWRGSQDLSMRSNAEQKSIVKARGRISIWSLRGAVPGWE